MGSKEASIMSESLSDKPSNAENVLSKLSQIKESDFNLKTLVLPEFSLVVPISRNVEEKQANTQSFKPGDSMKRSLSVALIR